MSPGCIRLAIRWWVTAFFVALAIPIGVFIGVFYVNQILRGPTVYALDATRVDDLPIRTGGELSFLVTRGAKPGENCIGYVSREFAQRVTVNGRAMWRKMRSPMFPPPIPDAAEAEYVVSVPIPFNATPGEWRFKGRTTYDCGFWFGGIVNYDLRPIYFSVMERAP